MNIFEDGERQKDLRLRPFIVNRHKTLCITDLYVGCVSTINVTLIYLLEIRLT